MAEKTVEKTEVTLSAPAKHAGEQKKAGDKITVTELQLQRLKKAGAVK